MMRRKLFYRRNSLDTFYPSERRRRTGALGILLGILAAVYFSLAPWPFQGFRSGVDLAILNEHSAAGNPNSSSTLIAEEAQSEPAPKTVNLTLNRGDTLLGMLMKHGLQGAPANDLINKLKPFYDPRRMRPGDSFRLLYDEDGTAIQALEHATSGALVRILSTAEGWVAERVEIPYVRATKVVRGSIRASLFEDGVGAGLSPGHIHKLADLFEHDIDFFSDIHRGDDFSVVLEEKRYANGESEKGRVLAAKIKAGGSPYQIFYFKGINDDKGSYYDTHGRTLMKAFLRAPLSYSRISSPFNLNRRHPIFRTVRPHQAIDYAAPTGTPVVSVGHGRVTFAGTRGGYGQMVEVQHNNGYVSRYAHFSRIAKGVRAGKSVSQGQVVGYVGQTGHATGPHLHFEMLNKGRKINFLDLKTAAQEKLTGAQLQEFLAFRDKKLPLLKGTAPVGNDESGDTVANARSGNARTDALDVPAS